MPSFSNLTYALLFFLALSQRATSLPLDTRSPVESNLESLSIRAPCEGLDCGLGIGGAHNAQAARPQSFGLETYIEVDEHGRPLSMTSDGGHVSSPPRPHQPMVVPSSSGSGSGSGQAGAGSGSAHTYPPAPYDPAGQTSAGGSSSSKAEGKKPERPPAAHLKDDKGEGSGGTSVQGSSSQGASGSGEGSSNPKPPPAAHVKKDSLNVHPSELKVFNKKKSGNRALPGKASGATPKKLKPGKAAPPNLTKRPGSKLPVRQAPGRIRPANPRPKLTKAPAASKQRAGARVPPRPTKGSRPATRARATANKPTPKKGKTATPRQRGKLQKAAKAPTRPAAARSKAKAPSAANRVKGRQDSPRAPVKESPAKAAVSQKRKVAPASVKGKGKVGARRK